MRDVTACPEVRGEKEYLNHLIKKPDRLVLQCSTLAGEVT